MILENQRVITPKNKIPKLLKGKIKIFSNCNLSMNEVHLYNMALQAVANHITSDNICLDDYYVLNVFFTETGKISFHEEKDEVNGSQIYMAIYKMKKLRKINNGTFILFVFIEELVHYFWRISDETIVKYKIVEVIQDIIPNFTIEVAKGWGLNGL